LKRAAITIETEAGLPLVGDAYGDAGPPVLLLHGGGQTRHSWRRSAQALAEAGFRAFAFDQRGHGDSGRAPDRRYTFFDYAADAVALAGAIERRSGARPAVVGASLGGLAALIAADRGADPPFAALVLVDVVPRMAPAGVAAVQGFMRDRAADGFADVEEAAAAIAAYLPHRPRPRSLDGLRKNLRAGDDGRLYWHWDRDFLDGPFPVNHRRDAVEAAALEAAARLRIPSLLVRGGSSELVGEAEAEEYLALAKDAEFVDVAEARHMVAGDSNDAFTAAVLGFLSRRVPEDAGAGGEAAGVSAP
jgi:pimeloyl-ACP methyl ester carboxylesterase